MRNKIIPTDINYYGINFGIAVADSLPTLIVWELIRITDTDFVIPEVFSHN